LLLLIDEKLSSLRERRPNSEEAQALQREQIELYESIRRNLAVLKEAVRAFAAERISERKTISAVKSFADGVKGWWSKGHEQICEKAFDMSMFLSAVAICTAAGSSGNLAVTVSAALVGGKPVAEALKGALKKL
jgi:hypothetical protein